MMEILATRAFEENANQKKPLVGGGGADEPG